MAAGDKTVKDLGYLSKNQGMASAIVRHNRPSAPGRGYSEFRSVLCPTENKSGCVECLTSHKAAGSDHVISLDHNGH